MNKISALVLVLIIVIQQYSITTRANDHSDEYPKAVLADIVTLKTNRIGFVETPVPREGEKIYLFILQSFKGNNLFPKGVSYNVEQETTRYFVAYDMMERKYVAFEDENILARGRDFVLIIEQGPGGGRLLTELRGNPAYEMVRDFGLGFGPLPRN